ncbi:MAG: ABC transporter ATP-binding protein, partial [Candidatus Dormiibacterota bacterium]
KTTTLRMLAGLIRPTAGTALVVGQAPGAPSGLSKIGCLIEGPAFYSYLSGYDNLAVVADYCGAPRSNIRDVLDLVELTPRAEHKYKTYSLGMKQRLGVAAALLKQPELLILDEPTNGLDPQGMADMRKLIIDIGRGDRTVLVSSHLLNEVEHMCTRVGVIQRGRVIAEGTVDELRSGPSVLEVRATPHDESRALLQRMLGNDAVTERDGLFRVHAEPEQAAQVNRALIVAGVEVSHLAVARRSLEDVFRELTGGEVGL